MNEWIILTAITVANINCIHTHTHELFYLIFRHNNTVIYIWMTKGLKLQCHHRVQSHSFIHSFIQHPFYNFSLFDRLFKLSVFFLWFLEIYICRKFFFLYDELYDDCIEKIMQISNRLISLCLVTRQFFPIDDNGYYRLYSMFDSIMEPH